MNGTDQLQVVLSLIEEISTENRTDHKQIMRAIQELRSDTDSLKTFKNRILGGAGAISLVVSVSVALATVLI